MSYSDPECRVYVGNLDRSTTWQSLKDHMKNIGTVLRADIFMDQSKRSKGCGIVEYQRSEDAQRAMEELTDTVLDGRKIFVREDREAGGDRAAPRRERPMNNYRDRGDRSDRGDRYDRDRGDRGDRGDRYDRGDRDRESRRPTLADTKGRQVFVSNLAWSVDWAALKDHFRAVGEVNYVDLYSLADGRSKGCGTVTFEHPEDAQAAITKFDGTMLLGRELSVRMDEGRPQRREMERDTQLAVE